MHVLILSFEWYIRLLFLINTKLCERRYLSQVAIQSLTTPLCSLSSLCYKMKVWWTSFFRERDSNSASTLLFFPCVFSCHCILLLYPSLPASSYLFFRNEFSWTTKTQWHSTWKSMMLWILLLSFTGSMFRSLFAFLSFCFFESLFESLLKPWIPWTVTLTPLSLLPTSVMDAEGLEHIVSLTWFWIECLKVCQLYFTFLYSLYSLRFVCVFDEHHLSRHFPFDLFRLKTLTLSG